MDQSKRRFLKSTLLFAPVIGAGFYYNSVSYEKLIQKAIYTRLHYLKLDTQGVSTFARDYAENFYKSKKTIISIDLAVTANEFFPGFTRLSERVHNYEDYIVIKFLESSNFFFNGSDENKPVKYLGINHADPYNVYCTNPFADFSYD